MAQSYQQPAGSKKPSKALTIVGISVLVIIALGVGIPLLQNLLKSDEQKYQEDLHDIRIAVLGHNSGYSPRYGSDKMRAGTANSGMKQYPLYSKLYGGDNDALKEEDVVSDLITTLGIEQTNPAGGKEIGGTPMWVDGDNTTDRATSNLPLYYHKASTVPDIDHWKTSSVTIDGIDYVVDSRDWFINIDLLVNKGYLTKIPLSISSDNTLDTANGSYSWYIDATGEVKSMLYSKPTEKTNGFQGVYP
jgi:hypothetical protein